MSAEWLKKPSSYLHNILWLISERILILHTYLFWYNKSKFLTYLLTVHSSLLAYWRSIMYWKTNLMNSNNVLPVLSNLQDILFFHCPEGVLSKPRPLLFQWISHKTGLGVIHTLRKHIFRHFWLPLSSK